MAQPMRNRPLLPNLAQAQPSQPHQVVRPLAPPTAPVPHERRPTRKGACEACRRRKSKCNGSTPCCQVCLSKGSKCVYIIDDTSTTLKTKNVRLKKDLSSILELFWDLQTKSATEAKELLDRIRSGDDISSLLRAGNLNKLKASQDAREEDNLEDLELISCSTPELISDDSRNTITPPSGLPTAETPSPASRPVSSNNGLKQSHQTTESTSTTDASGVLEIALPDVKTFKKAMARLHDFTGSLFHSFTSEEIQEMTAEIDKNELSHLSKASLCEISSMAAISSLYSRGEVAPELSESLYVVAKHFLDDAIEADPYRAIKVCVLLSMYNIVNKGTVALAYAELGLRLAHRQGLHNKKRPEHFTESKWLDLKQVFRTLMFAKGWMCATLGYVSDDGYSVDTLDHYEDVDVELNRDTIIQTEIAKISTLKAQLLRKLFNSETLSVQELKTVKAGLHDWYINMPPAIQLGNLSGQSHEDVVRRVPILLIHLQHLGGLMLVQRRIMLFFAHPSEDNAPSAELLHEAAQSVEDGLTAAKQSIRLLDLILEVNTLFNKCWLGIFQAYTSGLNILYGATQRLLYNHPEQDLTGDLVLVGKALGVLAHCGTCDKIAQQFHDTLKVYADIVSSITVEDVREFLGDATDSPPKSDYFFNQKPGNTKAHMVSRDLFKLLCRPFRSNPGITDYQGGKAMPWADTQSCLAETSLGVHQDWKWEEEPLFDVNNGTKQSDLVLEIFSTWQPGYWIDSSEPSGWAAGHGYADGSEVPGFLI